MNKLSILAISTITAISMTGLAHADYRWAGFYAGINAGAAFNNAQLKSQQLAFTNPNETCNTCSNFSTFSPGFQSGYLYPFPNFYAAGVEVDVSFNTNQTDSLICASNLNPDVYDRFTFRDQMQTVLKGRVGREYKWQQNILLPYFVVGISFVNTHLSYQNEAGDFYSNHKTQTGCLVGAGVEWAFRLHWSLRAEYHYANYNKANKLNLPVVYDLIDPDGKGHVNLSSNVIAVALNYWI